MQDTPRAASGRVRRNLALGLSGLVLVVTAAAYASGAQEQSRRPGGMQDFPDLTVGIRSVEGCLGVETARTDSGKNVIFAWFESKEAVKRWYYHDMHQGAQRAFFPDWEYDDEPMEDVPDNVGPILAIASITMGDKPMFEDSPMPISQIAIELYTPISGGINLGGRFAPKGLVIPPRKIIVDED